MTPSVGIPSQACQQQASRRIRQRPTHIDSPNPGRPADRHITVGSRPVRHAARGPIPHASVDTISTISNTVDHLDESAPSVQDYPDAEDYAASGGDDTDWSPTEDGLFWPADRRWRPLAATVGGVIAVGAIATAVIINSGDSASTKATVGAPTPRTVVATTPRATAPPKNKPNPTPSASPTPPLPRETVTTVTPTSPHPSVGPTRTPSAVPPHTAAPPGAALSPRTVFYRVTGTKQLLDLVNVIYTDARGFPATDFNVSLPWTKMVVLNPGVRTESVVATSLYGRLNCSIVNAQGQPVVASVNNTIIATCTR